MLLRKDGAEIDISLTVLPDLPPHINGLVEETGGRILWAKRAHFGRSNVATSCAS